MSDWVKKDDFTIESINTGYDGKKHLTMLKRNMN